MAVSKSIPLPSDKSISVKNLNFRYNASAAFTLNDINLVLPPGSRTLLLGGNGSGKSTFLKILSGRHMPSEGKVIVCGEDAYRSTKLNFWRSYLSCDWGMSTVAFGASSPMTASIKVRNMMEKLQNEYPERRDKIIHLLNINPDWMMNELSDGQRRRVQLLLQLVRPTLVVLLDEVTTSLDLCVRMDLLDWLKEEGQTVVYATHIFDHLDGWGTHLIFLDDSGRVGQFGDVDTLLLSSNSNSNNDMVDDNNSNNGTGKLLNLADSWLRKELNARRAQGLLESAAGGDGDTGLGSDVNNRQGGYASGRSANIKPAYVEPARQGRLSEMMGNKGKLLAHNNTTTNVPGH